MMNEMKLAKQKLGPDWIDLSYGEPTVITNSLHSVMNKSNIVLPGTDDFKNFQYQPAAGYPALVEYLENKYKTKVVVTNGARQGISAVAYALKKLGKKEIRIPIPMWPSTISLVQDVGLKSNSSYSFAHQALMVTSPSNPDGREFATDKASYQALKTIHSHVIHDAAYYTPIYSFKKDFNYNFADAQIFSYSKMYGLSGLRMGFVLCHEPELYPYIVEYIERSTSGVSIMAQMSILAIEKYFDENPEAKQEFESKARETIASNRLLLANLKPEVLEPIPCMSNSMFGWCKLGPVLDWKKSKVFMANGVLFGDSSMVRMNIAVPTNLLEDAIKRLNEPVD